MNAYVLLAWSIVALLVGIFTRLGADSGSSADIYGMGFIWVSFILMGFGYAVLLKPKNNDRDHP